MVRSIFVVTLIEHSSENKFFSPLIFSVDGNESDRGVWVKGHFLRRSKEGNYVVKHIAWDDQPSRTTTTVGKEDIRPPFPNLGL